MRIASVRHPSDIGSIQCYGPFIHLLNKELPLRLLKNPQRATHAPSVHYIAGAEESCEEVQFIDRCLHLGCPWECSCYLSDVRRDCQFEPSQASIKLVQFVIARVPQH